MSRERAIDLDKEKTDQRLARKELGVVWFEPLAERRI
jgi:hypothetical protein